MATNYSNTIDFNTTDSIDLHDSQDANSAFPVQWNRDDASSLNPSKPLKAHRGWERQPESPVAQKKRFGKVWRRFNSKPQAHPPSSYSQLALPSAQRSPRKVTKKLRLAEGDENYRVAATKLEKDLPSEYRKHPKVDTSADSAPTDRREDLQEPVNTMSDLDPHVDLDEDEDIGEYNCNLEITSESLSHIPPLLPGHNVSSILQREPTKHTQLDTSSGDRIHEEIKDHFSSSEEHDESSMHDEAMTSAESMPVEAPTIDGCITETNVVPPLESAENQQEDLGSMEEPGNPGDLASEAVKDDPSVAEMQQTKNDELLVTNESYVLPPTDQVYNNEGGDKSLSDDPDEDAGRQDSEEASPSRSIQTNELQESFVVDQQNQNYAHRDIHNQIDVKEVEPDITIANQQGDHADLSELTTEISWKNDVALEDHEDKEIDEVISPHEDNSNMKIQDEAAANQQKEPSLAASLSAHLDSDTAILQAFLERKQANKTNNMQTDSIARRTSLQNRRDSDAVRLALSSPRVLEDRDVNSPHLGKSANKDLDLSTPMKTAGKRKASELESHPQSDNERVTPARRSTRTRTRIPPPASGTSTAPPTNITIKSGTEPVILQRSDVQQLSYQTRANTRKNKFGALDVKGRLVKLAKAPKEEQRSASPADDSTASSRGINWADPLVTGSLSPSLDEDSEDSSSTQQNENKEISIPAPRRIKRLRGPTNGTPGKGLLNLADLDLPSSKPATKVAKAKRLPSPRKLKFTSTATEGKDASPKKLKLAHSELEGSELSPKKETMSSPPKRMKLAQMNEVMEGLPKKTTPRRKSGIPVGMAATSTRASARKRPGVDH
ncbi:MAG: hypothetical protein M1820_000238 [Bogoriella megaspora]|nr:MAG: hypothetical protein M1820_000238 [Bogoriella megaspora]